MSNRKGSSAFGLSLTAALSMTIDHVAVALMSNSALYIPLRAAGRTAFVIFAFLIAQSVEKTSSVKRFCTRLAVFAVITEPIFDITFYGVPFYPAHQNIFFTLLAGVAAVSAYKRYRLNGRWIVCGIVLSAHLLGFDYGGIGVMLIWAFWLCGRDKSAYVVAVFAAVTALEGGLPNLFALLAIPLILLYNGRRGGEKYPVLRRWFFYFYYPAHIAAIAMAKLI